MPSDGMLAIHHHAGEPRAVAEQSVFYYDFASPEAYLVAERMTGEPRTMPEWQPVALADLPGADQLEGWRREAERDVYMREIERRAEQLGLQPLRWPPEWPSNTRFALLAATYAKQIGRAVAFSLAAFRQAFAAGRDLAQPDNVLIAAAACELHPSAVLKGAALRSVEADLRRATQTAAAAGVAALPSLRVGARVITGEAEIARAMAGLGGEPEA